MSFITIIYSSAFQVILSTIKLNQQNIINFIINDIKHDHFIFFLSN